MHRDRLYQLAFLAVAAAALTGSALIQGPIERCRREQGMDIVGRGGVHSKDPRIALVQRVPGGLRAPVINYLWIRSQDLKQDGKFFDAKGLRDVICEMLPHHPGVWAFCSWDMAWNISVATHTPTERWMWISNGIDLLRDKGIVYNPEELILYRELSWIYLAKCGQYTDEMHRYYKQRWAEEMDWVVGTPPPGDTQRAIDAFAAVAGAPKTRAALLQACPAVAPLIEKLAALQVAPGASFLRNYNRLSRDPFVGELEVVPRGPRQGDPREAAIAALMAAPENAPALQELLAFSRRTVLEKTYRLDVEWMLAMMQKYGPFDWRHVDAHAAYWATYGLHRARGLALEDIKPGEAEARIEEFKKLSPDDPKIKQLNLEDVDRLNTERNVLAALKSLSRTGQLLVRKYADRRQPGARRILLLTWGPDWRFIEPTDREYILGGKSQIAGTGKELGDEENILADAQESFLEDVVLQLYFSSRRALAQHYFDEIKNTLKPTKKTYLQGNPSLDQFVRAKIANLGLPPADLARTFWMGSLQKAYLSLAAGDTDAFAEFRKFAARAHNVYVEDIGQAQRLRPNPFPMAEQLAVKSLLLRPASAEVHLTLLEKSKLYRAVGNVMTVDYATNTVVPMTAALYRDRDVQGFLRDQCAKQGLNFDLAFPPPPDIKIAAPGETTEHGRP